MSTSKLNIQISKVIASVLLLFLLQACSSYTEYKTEYAGTKQRWDNEREAKNNNVTHLDFYNFRLSHDTLYFYKRTHYVLNEYDFERYKEYSRYHRSGNLILLFIPIIGWTYCLADTKACLGSTSNWRDPTRTDKDERLSGNFENKVETHYFPRDTSVLVMLSGESKTGKLHKEQYNNYRSSLSSIKLKSIIEKWPEKPVTFRVDFEVSHDENTYKSFYELSSEQIASLSLKSDKWNSPEENRHKYFYELTSALQAGNHALALTKFKILEEMDFKKPESFWYRYAISAKRSGNISLAKEKAEKYLDLAEKRQYEKEAKALLAEKS